MTRTDIIDIIENALIDSTDIDYTFLSRAKGVYSALEFHKLLAPPGTPRHRYSVRYSDGSTQDLIGLGDSLEDGLLVIRHSDGGRTLINLAHVASVTID